MPATITTLAESIASTLEADPALAGIEVIVEKQKDTANLIRKAMAKAAGMAIVIAFAGARVPQPDAPGPRFEAELVAAVISHPVLRGDATPADEIVEAVCRALHGLTLPSPRPTRPYRLAVSGILPQADEAFVIHEITLTTAIQL